MGSPKHLPLRQGVQLNMGVHLHTCMCQCASAALHVLLCMGVQLRMREAFKKTIPSHFRISPNKKGKERDSEVTRASQRASQRASVRPNGRK